MNQIRPQEAFPIVYRTEDPNDSATYFVRAVVRNSVTGVILNFKGLPYVNLIQDPVDIHRYSATVQAPNDPSGFGFFIDVTTVVYTDSGYITLSLSYLGKNDSYLIAERWTIAHGSGGAYVNWDERMKKAINYDLIGEALKKSFSELPTTDIAPVDLSPVLKGHAEIKGLISNIPRPEAVDVKSHTDHVLSSLLKVLKGIKIPITDLSPIIKRLDSIRIPENKDYGPQFKELKEEFRSLIEGIKESLPSTKYVSLMEQISEGITNRPAKKPVKQDPFAERAKNLIS